MATEAPWEQISKYHTVASAVDFFNIHFWHFSFIGQHRRETGSMGREGARLGITGRIHTGDVELKVMVTILMTVKAAMYSFYKGNPL